MKTFFLCFVTVLLSVSQASVSAQSFHPNRSYQVTLDYSRLSREDVDEVYKTYLIHFNHGFHNEKGGSFLFDFSLKIGEGIDEMELVTFYRKAYLRKEKIEAYLGMELGARAFGGTDNTRASSKFFIAADAGYQFFLNKNTALEWNISYPFLNSEPDSPDPELGKYGFTSGRLNTSLRLRYYLEPQKNEAIAPNSYRLYRSRWMIGGSLELGALNEFDGEGDRLLNIINPTFGIMASEKWMFGSGIHISTGNNVSELIYFGASPFVRNYLAESNERISLYWELWSLLRNKAEWPDTTKDYDLFEIGAGTGFGLGYWMNPNVMFNFSLGIRLLLNAEEYLDSDKIQLYNMAYFKVGMESFL